ncbi:MAG: hypothetical protein R3B70_14305, partial [Polyangiaceae bacterium]
MNLSPPRTDLLPHPRAHRRDRQKPLSRWRAKGALPLLTGALALLSCNVDETIDPAGGCVPSTGPLPHDTLSEYCFFEGEMKDLVPRKGIYEYQVAAALWSDHAEKQRFIVLPEGKKITFDEEEGWQYPLGTILVKTFSFRDDFGDPDSPRRTLETRLLLLGEAGWTGEVYRWNDAQTEAKRIIAGERVDVTYKDEDGDTFTEEYIVPNQNQCKSCHERDDVVTFLGPFTQQLNRPLAGDPTKNQLEDMAEKGMFDSELPPAASLPAFADPFGTAPLD